MRKIIHVDMDCFYAAIEIRDNPSLHDKPVAVGSDSPRGVLCTCNYAARRYGVRSAMSTASAYRLCKDLIILPVNMPKYREVAASIMAIFLSYTDLVEPLSLDEAYLDVTANERFSGSGTLVAKSIREEIWTKEQLVASAGVAPNKFLAKIASGWKKPNGLFVIDPRQVQAFVTALPVKELHGVGKVTATKLHEMGIDTCATLQKVPLNELIKRFGKFGKQLYDQARGIDNRPVVPDRSRKSLSVERTFITDLSDQAELLTTLDTVFIALTARLERYAADRRIKSLFVKVKFNNFKLTTSETAFRNLDKTVFYALFKEAYARENKPVRLIGLGVHFLAENDDMIQESLPF